MFLGFILGFYIRCIVIFYDNNNNNNTNSKSSFRQKEIQTTKKQTPSTTTVGIPPIYFVKLNCTLDHLLFEEFIFHTDPLEENINCRANSCDKDDVACIKGHIRRKYTCTACTRIFRTTRDNETVECIIKVIKSAATTEKVQCGPISYSKFYCEPGFKNDLVDHINSVIIDCEEKYNYNCYVYNTVILLNIGHILLDNDIIDLYC